MESIDSLTKAFKFEYERFVLGCDALEEMDAWDKETFGEMDVFYENDLVALVIRLIAADGKISEKEVEYLNKNFGFDYTAERMAEVYENCRGELGQSFDANFKNGVALMKKINAKLAGAYESLLGLVCDIVIASDGVISPEEIEEAKRIKALV